MKNYLILALLMISVNLGGAESGTRQFEYNTRAVLENAFDASQLIGQWYFMSKDNDKKSKTENLTEGKSITLKKDHTFESDVFESMESGEWSFNKDTQILTLKSKNKSVRWQLKNVNDFGMVLIHLESKEKWTFAAAA